VNNSIAVGNFKFVIKSYLPQNLSLCCAPYN